MAVLGECMLELSASADDRAASKIPCALSYGGDSLNTSVYLARLGTDVNYVTALGDDGLSRWMVSQWQNEGVNCDAVHYQANSVPGMYLIELDAAGERTFKYWRKSSPASQWLEDDELRQRVFAQLESFDYLYLSGISVAIFSPQLQQHLIDFLQGYADRGGKVIFDGNYRANLWVDAPTAASVYQQLYRLCHLALPTLEDEQQIFDDADAQSAIERLQSYGVKNIVLKQGELGCSYLCDGSKAGNVPSHKVNVVDTTAAGDSFNAGFLHGFLHGEHIEQACESGHRLASTVIQHRGAIIPTSRMPIYC